MLDSATRAALKDFHDSKLRVLGMRSKASLSNPNIFDKVKMQHKSRQATVFGVRGSGMYQDYILKDLDKYINKRLTKLEKIIESRQ